jgi:hypothetical protein
MKTLRWVLCALPLSWAALACDGDDATTPGFFRDAGQSDAENAADTSTALNGAALPERDAGRPLPQFLIDADYNEFVTLDAAFPFGVTHVHLTTIKVSSARWGNHNGPMLTAGQPDDGSGAPSLYRFTIPADAKAPMTTPVSQTLVDSQATPVIRYYNAIIDLPSAQKSLVSYSGQGDAFPGEALVYGPSLSSAEKRAHVNGFFAAVATPRGAETRLVYTAVSPLASAPATTNDNGLYISDTCTGALVATAACPAGFALLKWTGASGTVAQDRDGNLFVAAFTMAKQEVYGFSKTEIAAASAQATKTPLFSFAASGTGGFAILPTEAAKPGYVLIKAYDGKVPTATTAQPFAAAPAITLGANPSTTNALVPGPKNQGYTLLTDPEGNLWLAIDTATGGAFLKLQRKPQ